MCADTGGRAGSAARGGWRAWAELLRAPLLFSPIADVVAGWSLGLLVASRHPASAPAEVAPDMWQTAEASLPRLGLAAGAGVFLLAAGMAQNAIADRADDALRKPDRPLPRGAISPRAAAAAMLAFTACGVACAALTGPTSLALCLAIVLLTAAYHGPLKRLRLPGCAALGTLRGLDLLLGAAAVAAVAEPSHAAHTTSLWPPIGDRLAVTPALLYALFMAGASLHASTDDSPASRINRVWSGTGLSLHLVALLILPWTILPAREGLAPATAAQFAAGFLAAAVTGWALVRLVRGWRKLPPGPLTGLALSGLYLFSAIVCLSSDVSGVGLCAAAFVLALFGVSRLMRRAFPPT